MDENYILTPTKIMAKAKNKPKRKSRIKADEILDLHILLKSTNSIQEFLSQI